jgi:phage shock protein E
MFDFLKKIFSGTDMTEIKEVIAQGGIIIDVRSSGEFSGGHPKNAKNIPLDKLESNIAQIKSMKKPIVVCCASGMRSARAKSILMNHGIEKVYDAGGWHNLNF